MSAESDLRRYRDDAHRLRTDISKASTTVAAKRKKAADASSAASRSSSPSTVRMKVSEAERATKEANDAEKKRADLEGKLAAVELKVSRTQEKWEKERQTTQDRAFQDLRRKTEQATAQFTAPLRGAATLPQASVTIAPARDIFLSHATEDKEDIARPLRDALQDLGVSVWFDEMQIKVGHSIRREIEKGIASCRFGVVIISPHFFAKQWTHAELDALFSKKMDSGDNSILPVWHHVSKDEVMQHSALLSGILALNSATMTTTEMAQALFEVVHATSASPS